MKRRILCLILCVITLVPLLAIAPSAATVSIDVVEQLKNYTIDGTPFDEANFPLNVSDTGIYILAIREKGSLRNVESTKWNGYGLDVYFYNPCGKKVFDGGTIYYTNSEENINKSDAGETATYNHYSSEDNRFFRVSLNLGAYRPNGFGEKRIYHFFGYDFTHETWTGDDVNYQSLVFNVDQMFTVYGYEDDGTMSYSDAQTRTLELELRGTAWRSENPKSESTPNIYTEIPTVYFTIPSDIYSNYDRVAQIAAQFWMFRSSPVVVTNSKTLNDMEDVAVMRSGLALDEYYVDVPTLSYGELTYILEGTLLPLKAPEWIYNPNNDDREYYGYSLPELMKGKGYSQFTEICPSICYYFYNADLKVDEVSNMFQIAVSDEEFEAYMQAYTEAYGTDLIGPLLGGISPDLYESSLFHRELYDYNDPNDSKDDDKTTYALKDFTFNGDRKWWEVLWGLNTGVAGYESVDKICEIKNPAEIAAQYANNLEGLANDYKIGKDDASGFLQYLQNADGTVVLLRLDATEYECHELNIDPAVSDGQAWLVNMNFYREVDVTEVTFDKDGKLYTYTVFADPININGGVGVKDDPAPSGINWPKGPDFSEWWNKIKNKFDSITDVLKFIGICLVVFFVIWAFVKLFGSKQKVTIKYDPPDGKRKRKK